MCHYKEQVNIGCSVLQFGGRNDCDETFSPVARIKTIKILIASAAYIKLKLFAMDVKSAFLNGHLKEEVYVKQPPVSKIDYPNHVIKLDKSLCGLKQAPKTCYASLLEFLLDHDFKGGNIGNTLFLKSK